jgi:hypothetical protein
MKGGRGAWGVKDYNGLQSFDCYRVHQIPLYMYCQPQQAKTGQSVLETKCCEQLDEI